jgi:hypothetical protein
MFFSSSDDFDQLDGRLFARARSLERELKKTARAMHRRREDARQRLPAL